MVHAVWLQFKHLPWQFVFDLLLNIPVICFFSILLLWVVKLYLFPMNITWKTCRINWLRISNPTMLSKNLQYNETNQMHADSHKETYTNIEEKFALANIYFFSKTLCGCFLVLSVKITKIELINTSIN